MSDYRLGKKVEPIPTPEAVDEYEYFLGQHGDRLMRNKRTKTIESAVPRRINVEPAPVVRDPFEHLRETLRRSQQQQEDDGFPVAFWGSM